MLAPDALGSHRWREGFLEPTSASRKTASILSAERIDEVGSDLARAFNFGSCSLNALEYLEGIRGRSP